MLYSYDIFDTIITRKTANPHGIFALMQKRLQENSVGLPEEIVQGFYELRIQGERLARYYLREKGSEEVTVGQIYEAIGTTGMVDDKGRAKLEQLEYETELENLIPIPHMVEEVREKVCDGERVIFISDMYWDREHLYGMLEKALPGCGHIPLYASSEIGKTKATGNLYCYVRDAEGVEYGDWIHTGDDETGDCLVPERLGIRVRHVHERKLLPIERAVLKGSGDDPSIQLSVGLSKNVRLLYRLQGVSETGASLGGFLVGNYVVWLLNDAKKRGIHTLYFIARDGYVLKEMADIFIKKFQLQMKTKYLYGSRKAWRIPGQAQENIDIFELLKVSVPEFIFDFASVADVFGISLSELEQFLPEGLKRRGARLSRMDVEIIFYYLAESDSFFQYLNLAGKEKHTLACDYLKQEIETEEEQAAFVEVGGTGYTQRCLENMIREFYTGKIFTYYFQLYSLDRDQERPFLNFIPDGHYMKDAIEPLCRALHGPTYGYAREGDYVKPLIEEGEAEYLQKCGYPDYIKGLRHYAECYGDLYREMFFRPIDRKLIRKCWDYYTHTNDKMIWDFVGEVPFSATGIDGKHKTYAPQISKAEIKDIFITHRNEPLSGIYSGSSLEASLLRLDEAGRKYLAECREENGLQGRDILRKEAKPAFVKIPTDRYAKGTRIALYGAGCVGKELVCQINEREEWKLAAWADRQYVRYRQEYLVESPEKLLSTCCDVVLIAVLDKKVAESIREDLVQMGIPGEKLDWISPEEYLEGYGHE